MDANVESWRKGKAEAVLPPSMLPRKPAYLKFDNIDDKREICTLLRRLSPARRITFFRWCCMRSRLSSNTQDVSRVAKSTIELAEKARWDSSADEMLTQEIYRDIFYLSVQHLFDIEHAVKMLEKMVRKG